MYLYLTVTHWEMWFLCTSVREEDVFCSYSESQFWVRKLFKMSSDSFFKCIVVICLLHVLFFTSLIWMK